MFLSEKSGDPNNLMKSAIFGEIVKVLIGTERKKFRLGGLEPQLLPAIERGQVSLYKDEAGYPRAYAIWAFVSDEVLHEICTNPLRLLHVSEWSEGLNLVIMDYVAPYGDARTLARHLREHEFPDLSRAFAIRHGADGSIKRIARFERASR